MACLLEVARLHCLDLDGGVMDVEFLLEKLGHMEEHVVGVLS